MRLNKLFVAAVAALIPAAMASAYTLSVNSPPSQPAPSVAGTVTITVSLAGAAGEQILSAQGQLQVPAPLTLTGGTGLGAGMIFTNFPLPTDGAAATQTLTAPNAQTRGRNLFVPTDVDGFPVPQTLVNGTLFTVVLNIPAGMGAGTYPINFVGASGTDTFVSDSQNNQILASGITNGALVITPEPATALLLIGALPFLRRRSA